MVEERTEAAAKRGAPRKVQPAKKQSAPKRRRRQPKDAPKALFQLEGTTVSTFTIGGGAVDVVLTGKGLDLAGLDVHIFDVALDQEVKGDQIIFELPQKDDITSSEFPMTVKVVAGNIGPRRIAMTFVVITPLGPVTFVSALPASLVT